MPFPQAAAFPVAARALVDAAHTPSLWHWLGTIACQGKAFGQRLVARSSEAAVAGELRAWLPRVSRLTCFLRADGWDFKSGPAASTATVRHLIESATSAVQLQSETDRPRGCCA